MVKKLEYCFIPKTADGLFYRCLECDYTSSITDGYVGYCNHIKYKHAKKEAGNNVDFYIKNYFKKIIEASVDAIPKEHEDKILGSCRVCNSPTEFRSLAAGYKVFCSHACAIKDSKVSYERNKKAKESLLLKYGVINASMIPGNSLKVKETKKLRYGNENYVNRDKAIETNLIKHGVENYTQTEEYKHRVKQTSLLKYGVEHFTQSDEVKEKIVETNLKRYGVKYSLQNKSVRERGYESLLKNGGYTLQRGDLTERAAYLAHKEAYRKRVLEYSNNGGFANVKLLDISTMEFQCLICADKFFTNPDSGLSKSHPKKYPRCYKCFPIGKNNKFSLFHQEFISFLIQVCGLQKQELSENNKSILKDINKEIDVFIPGKNIGFELNGNFWHTENHGGKERKYHLNKTEICEKNNIHLIHLFEDEWEKKRKLICSKILHLLGIQKENRKSVYARKCEIKEINSFIAGEFLEKYHVQGKEMSASTSLGAYNGEELVAVMTFGKPRINMGKGGKNKSESSIELIRFATRTEIRIPGIASKLFKFFTKISKPDVEEIYSYADRRWTYSKKNVYLELGFTETNRSDPNYFYVHSKDGFLTRRNRFSYRKSQLARKFPQKYNPMLTETQNMSIFGYDRIWDCGTIRYTWLRAKENDV